MALIQSLTNAMSEKEYAGNDAFVDRSGKLKFVDAKKRFENAVEILGAECERGHRVAALTLSGRKVCAGSSWPGRQRLS